MKTKTLTTTKFELAPPKGETPFSARMNLYSAERDLFLGGKNAFNAFKELMNGPLNHLEWRPVQARDKEGKPEFKTEEKPIIDPMTGKPMIRPRAKKPVMQKVVMLDENGDPIPNIIEKLLPIKNEDRKSVV
jgi:hypothetical protein